MAGGDANEKQQATDPDTKGSLEAERADRGFLRKKPLSFRHFKQFGEVLFFRLSGLVHADAQKRLHFDLALHSLHRISGPRA
jgi:hypothetical protein